MVLITGQAKLSQITVTLLLILALCKDENFFYLENSGPAKIRPVAMPMKADISSLE